MSTTGKKFIALVEKMEIMGLWSLRLESVAGVDYDEYIELTRLNNFIVNEKEIRKKFKGETMLWAGIDEFLPALYVMTAKLVSQKIPLYSVAMFKIPLLRLPTEGEGGGTQ